MRKTLPLFLWGLLLFTVNAVLLSTVVRPGGELSWVWTSSPGEAANSKANSAESPSGKSPGGAGPRIKVKEPTLALGQEEQAKEKPPVRAAEKVVVTSGVNMRSGPAASHGIIKTLPTGMELEVVSRSKGWTEVANPQSGERGWVYDSFIKSIGAGAVEARNDRPR